MKKFHEVEKHANIQRQVKRWKCFSLTTTGLILLKLFYYAYDQKYVNA